MTTYTQNLRTSKSRRIGLKILLLIIGHISLGLGVLGIFLPLLPTTPFLLLSLACFAKTSKKLHDFILKNKYLAPYVKDFMNGQGIPIRVKKRVILLIWLSIGFTVIFVIDRLILRLMLLSIASIVSLYIYTRKTPNSN